MWNFCQRLCFTSEFICVTTSVELFVCSVLCSGWALLLTDWMKLNQVFLVYSWLLWVADSYYIADNSTDLFFFCCFLCVSSIYLLLLPRLYFFICMLTLLSLSLLIFLSLSGWVWLWFRNQSQTSWFHVVSYISSQCLICHIHILLQGKKKRKKITF